MIITKKAAAKAFAQWEEDYRKDPERFMADKKRKSTRPKSFGELCAETFFLYLRR